MVGTPIRGELTSGPPGVVGWPSRWIGLALPASIGAFGVGIVGSMVRSRVCPGCGVAGRGPSSWGRLGAHHQTGCAVSAGGLVCDVYLAWIECALPVLTLFGGMSGVDSSICVAFGLALIDPILDFFSFRPGIVCIACVCRSTSLRRRSTSSLESHPHRI